MGMARCYNVWWLGFVVLVVLLNPCLTVADYPIASHHYAADPAALVYNDRLYLYCSNDDENWTNSYSMASIVCFSTEDLKNWTDHGVVFSATNHTTWASLAWAPSVVYRSNLFYLYFGNGGGSIGVATSSVPTGPFRDARGSALINSSTPGAYSPTQWYFDPCVFIDDDGQAYLYFGGQYPTNSRVIRLAPNMVSVNGSASGLETTNFFEAIYMHKRNGIYYLSYSTRPEAGMVIAYATSANPTNGFVYRGTVLPNPPQNVWNNNHHSIVFYKTNWYIAYHNRAAALQNGLSNEAAVYKRSICLDQLTYNADGTIQQVTPTVDGLLQLKYLDPYSRVEAETIAQQRGIKTEPCAEGGMNITAITNGSWVRIRGVNFGKGAKTFYARVASGGAGGNIELRFDSETGPVIGVLAVPRTGGWQNWTTLSATVTNASGVHDLYFRFTGGSGHLFNVNWWRFQPAGGAELGLSTTIEAESGILGTDWAVSNYTGTAAITILSNSTQDNPGSSNRVATYTVTFPAPGRYELYAKVRVGPNTWNDDSFFYGNGFGIKSPTNADDWIQVNGLASAGFIAPTDVVQGRGSAGANVWKWVNLSQYDDSSSEPPITFLIPENNLTQTFQVAAREDGLEIDKLVFALQGYVFTVADLDAGNPGTKPTITVAIDATKTYQTIEGLGGAICFYIGWVTAHPYKQEIYTNAFAGLNLSMLRLGNWFRYTNAPDSSAFEIVSNANRILGRPVPILMSSWAPPAFLKSNGQCGGGGTLATNATGQFMYNEFGQYWYDALQAYRSNGVWPTWISIQNEPDWEADYDSCIFRPTEGVYNGTNYASYAIALDTVYRRLTNLPAPPRLLAPEVVHIRWNTLQNYAATMNPNSFYGVAYHLYGDSVDGTVDGYIPSLRSATNIFPTKPKFMTEYGVSNMIDSATLIHNCLTEGMVSGYNYWNLVWPGVDGGLIQIEFPWDRSRWTNAPPGTPTQSRGYWLAPAYWSMKHFSYFIVPGSVRIGASCNNTNIRVSAFLTSGNNRLVAVLINRARGDSVVVNFDAGMLPYISSAVYQTTTTDVYEPGNTNRFVYKGELGQQLVLPAESLTTVVVELYIVLGYASNPSPPDGASNVPYDTVLTWTPGTNALMHAVYLGVNSNAVALAGPGSPEFRAVVTTNRFAPANLEGSTTYYWRVDEIAGVNTNIGVVWSFTTAPAPPLKHRYSFSELGGTTVADSAGGPAWNGALPNGGTLAGGTLTLSPAAQQHVQLPAGIVSGLNDFTMAAWVRFNSLSNWTRIFDFGNNTTTNMFLTPRNSVNGRVRFAITTSGASGEQRIDGVTLTTGAWYHIAVTLNGNIGTLYVNGVPVGTNTAMTLRPSSPGVTVNNYIGRSQYSWDPYLDAVLDEFRIYRVALSGSEIAAMYALGPDKLFDTEPPVLSVSISDTVLTLGWPLASAGFRLQSCTNLLEANWVDVTSPVPQIVGDKWLVTLPVSTSAATMFYRLAR